MPIGKESLERGSTINDLPKGWWLTKKGNYCRKIDGEFLTVFECKDRIGYTYVFMDEFCEDTFADPEEAIMAAEEEYGDG